MQFQKKIVAVTGAAGGIGRGLCRYFGAQGASVAALDRSQAVTTFADELRTERIRTESAVVDIGDANAVAAAFTNFESLLGPIDILINNAGASSHPSLERTTPEGFAQDVHINVNGAYNCAYAVLPGMKARRAGIIVNIGSVNGLGAYGDAAYSVGKAGLISLTKSLALEFGRYNLRVNIVCPATVRTPIWDERASRNPQFSSSSPAGIRSAASSNRSKSFTPSPFSPPMPHRASPAWCSRSTADSRPGTS